ncbi:MAG: glycosyltransferase, partial [Sulfuricurvum sp.]|nr:glycosyltransferase [Sulfuricurvum sp.]
MPDKKLIVIGDGPDFEKIKAKAGANVLLMGYQPFEVLRDTMQRAKAFVFAAEEDFGIAPVEAQACGTPVIAFGRGGATETVVDGMSGLFFDTQSVESLCEAVGRFEAMQWEPGKVRENAIRFGNDRFKEEFQHYVQKSLKQSGLVK